MAKIVIDVTDSYKKWFKDNLNGKTQKEFLEEAIKDKIEKENGIIEYTTELKVKKGCKVYDINHMLGIKIDTCNFKIVFLNKDKDKILSDERFQIHANVRNSISVLIDSSVECIAKIKITE